MNRTTLAGVLILASVLAGCSGQAGQPAADTKTVPSKSQAGAKPPAKPTTEASAPDQKAALAQAVTDYTNAYFEADWDTAYTRLWSARCKADSNARNGFIGTIAAQKANYPGANKPRAGAVTEERIDGTVGIVTYSYSFNGQSQVIENQPWILEGGAWHFDDC